MNLVIGILIYRSDLEVLAKSINMMLRQSIWHLKPNFTISLIIQDNDGGAQIPALEKMLSEIPDIEKLPIHILESENVGFGAGHNAIFREAKEAYGDFGYYLCMNPDGMPHFRLIDELVEFADRNENRGVFEARQFPVEHPKPYDLKTGRTDWCSACCLLIPRRIYEDLDGFDDLFFMYMEDVDFSWRVKLKGYGCYTVHEALFFHAIGDLNLGSELTEKLMLISGFKLATKFQDDTFKTLMRDLLSKYLDEYEIEELDEFVKDHFKEVSYPLSRFRRRPRFINFGSGMSFAHARW